MDNKKVNPLGFGLNSSFLGGLAAIDSIYGSKEPKFTIYEDSKEPVNKFRWRITMSSDIVAASSQGYKDRSTCLENAKKIMEHLQWLNTNKKLV